MVIVELQFCGLESIDLLRFVEVGIKVELGVRLSFAADFDLRNIDIVQTNNTALIFPIFVSYCNTGTNISKCSHLS